jgi:hypothetical protein
MDGTRKMGKERPLRREEKKTLRPASGCAFGVLITLFLFP